LCGVGGGEEYRAKVQRAGLAFRPLRPSFEDMQRSLGMDRAQLAKSVLRHGDFLFRRLMLDPVRAVRAGMPANEDGATRAAAMVINRLESLTSPAHSP